jgi:hypothetical protein
MYLSAISVSLARAYTSDPVLRPVVESIALVGSVAEHLRTARPAPNDLDIVVTLSQLEPAGLQAIRARTADVLKRYSCSRQEFVAVWDYGPSATHHVAPRFPVQVIIHTGESAAATAPFIRYDRSVRHVDLHGTYEVANPTISFGPTQVIDSPRGLVELRRALAEAVVPVWSWIEQNGRAVKHSRDVALADPAVKRTFLRYALRWSAANSLRAVGHTFESDEPLAVFRASLKAFSAPELYRRLELAFSQGAAVDWSRDIDDFTGLAVGYLDLLIEHLRRRIPPDAPVG